MRIRLISIDTVALGSNKFLAYTGNAIAVYKNNDADQSKGLF